MLTDAEYDYVFAEYRKSDVDLPRARDVCLERYRELTGFDETNPNAIAHHVISLYGPPCPSCGKPYRTPETRVCFECENDRTPRMPEGSTLRRVAEIVAPILESRAEDLVPGQRLREDLGADSLDGVQIVLEAEEVFDITIPDEEADQIRTIGDVADLVVRLGQ